MTKSKAIRKDLKRARSHLDRVRELWRAGAIPDSLGLLLEVRRILYRHGSSDALQFQASLRTIMQRVWPFLLKTGRFRSEVKNDAGVTQIRMFVPEGTYTMTLPAGAKPGDIVSGRIQAKPAPSASLYMLTVMGKAVVPDETLRKWVLPESLDLALIDQWQNEAVRVNYKSIETPPEPSLAPHDPSLQVEKQPREAKQNIEIPHLRFEISAKAKSGGHLIVQGPFDGDASNTLAGIGPYQGHIVAESPGRLVLYVHPQMTGDWVVLVKEEENWARCVVKMQPEELDPFATLSTCIPPPKVSR